MTKATKTTYTLSKSVIGHTANGELLIPLYDKFKTVSTEDVYSLITAKEADYEIVQDTKKIMA